MAKYPNCYGSHLAARLRKKAKLVVINMHDFPSIDHSDYFILKQCHLYFKREIPQNILNPLIFTAPHIKHRQKIHRIFEGDGGINKLKPISLGIHYLPRFDHYLTTEKTIDLLFLGAIEGLSVRENGIRWLHELKREGVNVEFSTVRLPRNEFLREMCILISSLITGRQWMGL